MAHAIVYFLLLAVWTSLVTQGRCAAVYGAVNVQADLLPRQVEIPTTNSFRWRALMSLAIVGDYLYIDGGEINQFINGEVDKAASRQVNTTLSLPLAQSWTNTTVTLKSFKRSAPNSKNFALWSDPVGKKAYAWGGEGPYGNTTGAKNVHLWALTPDGSGGGSWAASPPNNPAIFTTLVRATNGEYATCNGVGYHLGGEATSATDASISGHVVTPGLLSFDMSTSTWTNQSAPAPYATLLFGQGACLPFGPKGLVAFFGGGYRPVDNVELFSPILFSNITFFDPSTNQWLWQRTTGDIPDNRNSFCSVGVAGLNGTYEIFIYGGFQNTGFGGGNSQTILSDIWVLTIPGFQWFKTGVPGTPRWAHACTVAGKRQMLVVGGVHSWDDPWTAGNPSADPLSQGLGILDLSSLRWSDRYDSAAAAYDSPQIVKTFYDNGGLAAVNWVSSTVKSMFVNGSQITPTSTPTTTPSTSPSNSSTPNTDSQKSNTPAIAGGVAGGVGLIALIAGVIFCLRRRKRSQTDDDSPPLPPPPLPNEDQNYSWIPRKAELDAQEPPPPKDFIRRKEVPSAVPLQELSQNPSSPRMGELDTRREWDARHELHG